MFQTVLSLRLLLLAGCNALPDGEDAAAARTWAELMDVEAQALIDGSADWMPALATLLDCGPETVAVFECRARDLGRADGRLSLILADQLVAALIRGHLTEALP